VQQKEYEYHGLLASSWDLLRDDTSDFPDRQFFRDIILDNGQPALDVGCGTGRLLLKYVADGLDVDGVDISPEMLAICQQKADKLLLKPNLFRQSMGSLNLPRHYATIFVTSSSFQLVTDQGEANQVLINFHQHLKPNGLLVMSIMADLDGSSAEWYLVGERLRPDDGLLLRRWERARYDVASQLRHTENRFELLKDGEIVYSELHQRSPEMRVYSLGQISRLLSETGYHNIRAVSEFSDKLASAEDSVFCIFGEK
jgi:SAM-dependent methyltransferase